MRWSKRPVFHQNWLCRSDYARCRIELAAARLTVLAAAHALDKHGKKKARGQIAAGKVYAPNVVLRVIDAAIQVCHIALLLTQGLACTEVHAYCWHQHQGSSRLTVITLCKED